MTYTRRSVIVFRGRHAYLVALLLLGACRTVNSNSASLGAGIDHIVLGVATLDAGIAQFHDATGVMPVRGGRHPLRGTENALVSLGGNAYLEIMATRADAEHPTEFERHLRTRNTLTVVMWAIRVRDINSARDRILKLGFRPSAPQPGSRITPAGQKLEWTTLNIEQPQFATAPFFIQWSATTVHPATTSPGGCSLVSFEVEDPKSSDLSRLLDAFSVAVRIKAAERPHMRLRLGCNKGDVRFQSE